MKYVPPSLFLITSLTCNSSVKIVVVPVTVPSFPEKAIATVPVKISSGMSAPHNPTLSELPSSPAYFAANSP